MLNHNVNYPNDSVKQAKGSLDAEGENALKNNGDGSQPGDNNGKNVSTYNKNIGAQAGYYYPNNDWGKVTVTYPPYYPPGIYNKWIEKPFTSGKTMFEDENRYFDQASGKRDVNIEDVTDNRKVSGGTQIRDVVLANTRKAKISAGVLVIGDSWKSAEQYIDYDDRSDMDGVRVLMSDSDGTNGLDGTDPAQQYPYTLQWSKEYKTTEQIQNVDDTGWFTGQPDASAQSVRAIFKGPMPTGSDGKVFKVVIPMRVRETNPCTPNPSLKDYMNGLLEGRDGDESIRTERTTAEIKDGLAGGLMDYLVVQCPTERNWTIDNKVRATRQTSDNKTIEAWESRWDGDDSDEGIASRIADPGDTLHYTVTPTVHSVTRSSQQLNPTITVALDADGKVVDPVNTSDDWNMTVNTDENGNPVSLTFTLKNGPTAFAGYTTYGDLDLPDITYDVQVRRTVSGGVANEAKVAETDPETKKEYKGDSDPANVGLTIRTIRSEHLTVPSEKTEIEENLVWQFDLFSANQFDNGQMTTVIKLPQSQQDCAMVDLGNKDKTEGGWGWNEYPYTCSNYHGSYQLDGPVQLDDRNSTNTTILYAIEVKNNADVNDTGYTWKTWDQLTDAEKKKVSAIKVVSDFTQTDKISSALGTITLKPTGNQQGDEYNVWVGQSKLPDDSYADAPWSRKITVVASSLSGTVWWDNNNNAKIEVNGSDKNEKGIADVPVYLWRAKDKQSGNWLFRDAKVTLTGEGSAQTCTWTLSGESGDCEWVKVSEQKTRSKDGTNAAGKKTSWLGGYRFDVLHSGVYRVTMSKTDGAAIVVPEAIKSYYKTLIDVDQTYSYLNKLYENAKTTSDVVNLKLDQSWQSKTQAEDGTVTTVDREVKHVDFGFYATEPKVSLNKTNKQLACPVNESQPCTVTWDITITNHGNTTIPANQAKLYDRTSDNVTITNAQTKLRDGVPDGLSVTMLSGGAYYFSADGRLYYIDSGHRSVFSAEMPDGTTVPDNLHGADRYGYYFSANGRLYVILNGSVSVISGLENVTVPDGLARENTRSSYSSRFYFSTGGKLYMVDPNQGSASVVSGLDGVDVPDGLRFESFRFLSIGGKLYVLDPNQGSASVVSGLDGVNVPDGLQSSIAYYYFSVGGKLYMANANRGSASVVSGLDGVNVPDGLQSAGEYYYFSVGGKLYMAADRGSASVVGGLDGVDVPDGLQAAVDLREYYYFSVDGKLYQSYNEVSKATASVVSGLDDVTVYAGLQGVRNNSSGYYYFSAGGEFYRVDANTSSASVFSKIDGVHIPDGLQIGSGSSGYYYFSTGGNLYLIDMTTRSASMVKGITSGSVPDGLHKVVTSGGSYYFSAGGRLYRVEEDWASTTSTPSELQPSFGSLTQDSEQNENNGYIRRTYTLPASIKPGETRTFTLTGTLMRTEGKVTYAANQAWFDYSELTVRKNADGSTYEPAANEAYTPRSGTPTGDKAHHSDVKTGAPAAPKNVTDTDFADHWDKSTGDLRGDRETDWTVAEPITSCYVGADFASGATVLSSLSKRNASSLFGVDTRTLFQKLAPKSLVEKAAALDGDEHTFGARDLTSADAAKNGWPYVSTDSSAMREDSCDQVAVEVPASTAKVEEGKLSGVIWLDLNKDGRHTDADKVTSDTDWTANPNGKIKFFPNTEVYLIDKSTGERYAKTMTDENGYYVFDHLPLKDANGNARQWQVQFSKPTVDGRTFAFTKNVTGADFNTTDNSDASNAESDGGLTVFDYDLTAAVLGDEHWQKNVDAGVIVYGPSVSLEKFADLSEDGSLPDSDKPVNWTDRGGKDDAASKAEYERENNVAIPVAKDSNGVFTPAKLNTVLFVVQNTGDEPLTGMTLDDVTVAGSEVDMSRVRCVDVYDGAGADAKQVSGVTCAYDTRTHRVTFTGADGDASSGELAPGRYVRFQGASLQLKSGEFHADTATVRAHGARSFASVEDSDDMHAYADVVLGVTKKDYQSDQPVSGAKYELVKCTGTNASDCSTVDDASTITLTSGEAALLPLPRTAMGSTDYQDGTVALNAGKVDASAQPEYWKMIETSAPEGYLPSTGYWVLSVTGDPTVATGHPGAFSAKVTAHDGAEASRIKVTSNDTDGVKLTFDTTDPDSVKLIKTAGSAEAGASGLKDAKFRLHVGQQDADGNWKPVNASCTGSAADDPCTVEITSGDDGTITIDRFPGVNGDGLNARGRTYLLEEIAAPIGYLKLTGYLKLSCEPTGWQLTALEEADKGLISQIRKTTTANKTPNKWHIANRTLISALPLTGGLDTARNWLVVGGSLAVLAMLVAVAYHEWRKRKPLTLEL